MRRIASDWHRVGIAREAVEPLVADYVARNRADPYAGAEHDRRFERELHAIADQHGAAAVFQRAGHDLGRRGAVRIHQHRQRVVRMRALACGVAHAGGMSAARRLAPAWN